VGLVDSILIDAVISSKLVWLK